MKSISSWSENPFITRNIRGQVWLSEAENQQKFESVFQRDFIEMKSNKKPAPFW